MEYLGSAPVEFLAQWGTAVGLLAEHAFFCFTRAGSDAHRTIGRFASDQEDGDKTSFSICQCIILRIAPSARAVVIATASPRGVYRMYDSASRGPPSRPSGPTRNIILSLITLGIGWKAWNGTG
jgi:hypothetical protein